MNDYIVKIVGTSSKLTDSVIELPIKAESEHSAKLLADALAFGLRSTDEHYTWETDVIPQ